MQASCRLATGGALFKMLLLYEAWLVKVGQLWVQVLRLVMKVLNRDDLLRVGKWTGGQGLTNSIC